MKAAVIGVGYLGKFHAEKYARSKNVDLCAIVDIDAALASKFARKHRTESLADYRKLSALGVRCASVVTPTTTHYKVTRWLLENGIDVLVEKPFTATADEARKLIEIAKLNDRIIQVGHLERFNPAFCAVKRILTQPRFFEVRRIAPFAGRGYDVDVVQDLMIHDIDIVAHLVNRPLKHVEAVGVPVLTKTVDIANARLTFDGGAIANVSASRAAFSSERTIRIFQPNIYISLDYEKKKLKIYRKTNAVDKKGFAKIDVQEMKVDERDALEHEIASFVEAVDSRFKPEVSGEDGLRALELADKIREAFSENKKWLDQAEIVQPEFSSPEALL